MSALDDTSKKLAPDKRELLYQLFQKEKRVPALLKQARSGPVPLSFAQQRLWFEHSLNPTSSEYHIPSALHITGPLNRALFDQAISAILARHEVLRTCFQTEQEDLCQVVIPVASARALSSSVLDLRSLPEQMRQREARRVQEEEMRLPFDLARGPLVRLRILCMDTQEHIVLLIMHHIVIDAWSTDLFFRELSELYNAFVADLPVPLEPVPLQYADFALWQRQRMQGAVLEEGLAYWKRYLDGAPTFLQLPTDYPRPQEQHLHYHTLSFPFPQTLTEQLRSLARQEGASFFMLMLAAFQVLLFRYSGQADFLIGYPIGNRQSPETRNMPGFFLNTLVLRAHPTADLSFLDLLRQTRDEIFTAYQFQDIPFEKVIDAIHARRDKRYHPVFQVMFVLQNIANQQLALNGLKVQFMDVEQMHSRFDITLNVQEARDSATGLFQYNTALFRRETIERMSLHFQELLANIVASPERSLSRLALLAREEYEQVLFAWNKTDAPYPEDHCLHQLFQAQTLRAPEKVALVFEGEQLTYAELNRRANRLARYLQRLHVGPDVPVGLCMKCSVEMVVSLLAILKAGGAYVPIDPAYPGERIAFLLEASRVPLLLTQRQTGAALQDLQARTVYVDEVGKVLQELSGEDLPSFVAPENLAYVIFTSGSTGVPKGISMPHRPLVNLLAWHQEALPDAERTLQFASLGFDASCHELFSAWVSGGAACVITEDLRRDPPRLASYLNEHAIDKCILPVVILQQLAEERSRRKLDFPFLRTVITTGEQLRVSHFIREMFRQLPGCTLHNHYGPAETHVVTAFTLPTSDQDAWPVYPSIGRAVANTRVYVLDTYLQPVPVGIPGELYLGGVCLARGYLHRPEFTAERFLANPFSGEQGDLLYKTGDLVRLLADGNLEYLGRLDHQVKLRGIRIEPGEIESLLVRHPSVQDALVLVQEDEPGEKQLVAYIVPIQRSDDISSVLRAYLKARLPDYMIPSAFLLLNTLPLTPNGKVDRRALPRYDYTKMDLHASYAAPTTEVERLVATVWQEVLRRERVGLSDNFFEIGGHSLLAARLLTRLQTLFHVEIPLKSLFEHSTLAAFVRQLETLLHQQRVGKAQRIEKASYQGPVPLSFAQQRMWFFDQLASTSLKSHIPLFFRLSGPLDRSALERSLREIVTRHEILRTVFPLREKQPQQVIVAPEHFADQLFSFCDLSRLESDQRAGEIQRILAHATDEPFELARGPLMRALLLREEAENHVLALVFHHIIFDGVSEEVLRSELSSCYQAFSAQQAPDLPPLPVQYTDFVFWQQAYLRGRVLEEGLSYWKRHLSGITSGSSLPTDHARPPVQSFDGAAHTFLIPGNLAHRLRKLSGQAQVTLFMTLLAAFRLVIFSYSGQEDFLIGTPAAARSRAETEGLIGCFVNTLILRVDLTRPPTFLALLAHVRETALKAYLYQDIPFEQIVHMLHVPRDSSRHPLFQVVFMLHQAMEAPLTLQGLTVTTLESESRKTKFDLTLAMREAPESLVGIYEYNTALFQRETIEQLAQSFVAILEEIVSRPEHPLAELKQAFRSRFEREILPLSGDYGPISQVEFMAPQTEIEQAITAIWRDLLHVERIGIYDNFFDIGGHSLLLVQVQSTLKERLCPTVTMLDLFVHPTIYSLAQYIQHQSQESTLFEKSDTIGERRLARMKRLGRDRRRERDELA